MLRHACDVNPVNEDMPFIRIEDACNADFIRVDLPEPLEPMTVTKSPSSSVRLTPRRAFFSFGVFGKKVL